MLCVFGATFLNAQIDRRSKGGIGTGGGVKTPYGDWGIFYDYTPTILSKRLELNIGAGISQSLAIGLGSKFLIYHKLQRIELFLSLNYSYQVHGRVRYDAKNSVDYYATGTTQYIHYYLTGRFWFDRFAALQLNSGYSENLSGIRIRHSSGPNENYNNVRKTLDSGLLIGVDLVVFLESKNGND